MTLDTWLLTIYASINVLNPAATINVPPSLLQPPVTPQLYLVQTTRPAGLVKLSRYLDAIISGHSVFVASRIAHDPCQSAHVS